VPRHPVTDEETEHGPGHRENDAEFCRIVVIAGEAFVVGLGIVVDRNDFEDSRECYHHDECAMNAERFILACDAQYQSAQRDPEQNH